MFKFAIRFFLSGLLAATVATPGGNVLAQSNAVGAGSAADKISALLGDPVLARGKGVEIKRSEFDTAFVAVKSAATTRGARIPPEALNSLERQVLNDLIGMRLILNKATAEEKTAAQADFEQSFQKFKTEENLTDAEYEERLGPQLLALGLTREKWQQQRVDQATIKLVLERELKPNVTDDDVKKYYGDHPSEFERPEMLRASHVLLSTRDPSGAELSEAQKQAKRKQMEELLKRARGGEDFAKLVKEYSEDIASKSKGGEYTFGRGRMVPAFESAAFSLSVNQISDIVTTQFGYHIIKLLEKMPAQKLELAKVSDDLKERLKQRAIQDQLKDYIPKLIQEANIEILDERLKPRDNPAPLEPAEPKKP